METTAVRFKFSRMDAGEPVIQQYDGKIIDHWLEYRGPHGGLWRMSLDELFETPDAALEAWRNALLDRDAKAERVHQRNRRIRARVLRDLASNPMRIEPVGPQ